MSKKKFLFVFCLLIMAVFLFWVFNVIPQSERYSAVFSYSSDVISVDNFYDEGRKMYLGAELSKTKFYYETIEAENGILTIRNVFDVRKMTGEKIFAVDRIYGVNAKTGKHVQGRGDKNRTGYLFAPKNVDKKDYIYWHINYDEPALMKFQAEEVINGLKVYRYAADYNADQTDNLGFLPGVPEKRGVNLDIHLEQWIEPVSGHMVKYEDSTTCYYYDQKTKKRVYVWNKFNNKFSTTSINEQTEIAKNNKKMINFRERTIPGILGLLAFMSISCFLFISRKG